MMHHIDVHVRDLEAVRTLFDALSSDLGYERVPDEAGFVGYAPVDGSRPRIGFTDDGEFAAGSIRIAFGVAGRDAVERSAATVRRFGGQKLEGPSLHPEYGDDYYALFFEDGDGNRYEIVANDNQIEATS
jgi:predicted lactoylglutathione lyase